jgi:hypothetical protein
MGDNDSEPWFAGIVRSLTCATPRKRMPAQHDKHADRLSCIPNFTPPRGGGGGGHSDGTSGIDLEDMRRRASELDREIAGLRQSLGGSISSDFTTAPAAAAASASPIVWHGPATPAAATRTTLSATVKQECSRGAPHESTPSTPSLPAAAATSVDGEDAERVTTLSSRVSGAFEDLSRGIRRAVARAQSPGGQYGTINGTIVTDDTPPHPLPSSQPNRQLSKVAGRRAPPPSEQEALHREREVRHQRQQQEQRGQVREVSVPQQHQPHDQPPEPQVPRSQPLAERQEEE